MLIYRGQVSRLSELFYMSRLQAEIFLVAYLEFGLGLDPGVVGTDGGDILAYTPRAMSQGPTINHGKFRLTIIQTISRGNNQYFL